MNHDREREERLQAEAERAERERRPPGGDPDVDSYRLIVRALREPLRVELPAAFAASVAARVERAPARALFEERMTAILLWVLGLAAVLFAGAICADALLIAIATVVSKPGLQPLGAALLCIAAVWALDAASTRLRRRT